MLPPASPERLIEMLGLLEPEGTRRAALVGPDATQLDLPTEVFEVLRKVVQAMANGLAVTVAPQSPVLSTSEAAQLLGVSRPTLVRLLEAGEMPYEQPGRHRRVRLADVLAYQAQARRARGVSLDEMVQVSEDSGFYGVRADEPVQRVPVGREHE